MRTFRFEDLMAVERISAPSVSPDGMRVAFVASRHDSKENQVHHTIKILDRKENQVTEITPGPGNHTAPLWSPDGRCLALVSDRGEGKENQIWLLPAQGGEARCLTAGAGGVGQLAWAPDSRSLAFSRKVVVSADYDPKQEKKACAGKEPEPARVYGLNNLKSSARIADDLLFRHWDGWRERRRNHILIVDVASGKTNDLTPGDHDAPPISLGSERDFVFSPDGKELAWVMNPDRMVARSTNNSIFTLPIRGIRAAGAWKCISTTEACDTHPRYSRDGRFLFYLGMSKPGYEADKNRIKMYDRVTGETRAYLDRFDRSPLGFEFVDDQTLIFLAHDRGRQTLYRLELASGRVRQMTLDTFNTQIRVIPGSKKLLVIREALHRPADFYELTLGAGIKPILPNRPIPATMPPDAGTMARPLTQFRKTVSKCRLNPAESFWFAGAHDTPIHGFLIRPPNFSSRKKYPLIVLIHGGPQMAWLDQFHYRWNAQMFAAAEAVVALVNPRGSTGYGQKFIDQISGDWGGRCYQDLMLGVDYLLAHFSFIDPRRLAAAGGSFGGFMVNWIAGHTDRFRALASHDGVFFSETMAYTTDELWFDEHEHQGFPHENRRAYLKESPHRLVSNFKTPTLVIQGEKDFRCPVSEGVGLFTALQVMGVPSRLLYFPDEGHWVLQPANAQVWYEEVIGWLKKYLNR